MSELIKREDAIKATWQEPSYTDPLNVLTEVRDRINALPTIPAPRWHRVEEKLPSAFQDVWAACKMNGRENWTIETTYDPYLSCPWGYNIPVLESGKAVVYAWMDRSAPEPPVNKMFTK